MNILIADGSEPVVERIKNLIEQEIESPAVTVYGALSFKIALEIFKEHKPDIVLLGMNLQGNNSIGFLQAIREITPRTCIIILSLHLSNTIREQCNLLGVTVFLDKFLEFDKIPDTINNMYANRMCSSSKYNPTKNQK